MRGLYLACIPHTQKRLFGGLLGSSPAPGIAEPERRQQGQLSRFFRPIHDLDSNEDILEVALRVLYENIEVAAVIEDTCVVQVVFPVKTATLPVLFDKLSVRKLRLRILVEPLQVRSGWSGVEIVVNLFDVLSVIALFTRQAEESLFENRVFAIPQGDGEAEKLVVVADAKNAIFGPPVRTRPRVLVREVVPSITVRAVILPNGAPGALSQIRTEAAPVFLPRLGFGQSSAFRSQAAQATLVSATTSSGCLYLHSLFGHCATGPDFRYFSIR
jgi:hypothetical protein